MKLSDPFTRFALIHSSQDAHQLGCCKSLGVAKYPHIKKDTPESSTSQYLVYPKWHLLHKQTFLLPLSHQLG